MQCMLAHGDGSIDETSELEDYNPLLVEQIGLAPQNPGIGLGDQWIHDS